MLGCRHSACRSSFLFYPLLLSRLLPQRLDPLPQLLPSRSWPPSLLQDLVPEVEEEAAGSAEVQYRRTLPVDQSVGYHHLSNWMPSQ